jgi:serine/threonine protein kinase
MGVVYRAVPEDGGSAVALKVLRSELAESGVYVRRFEREARIARSLTHEHLVPVMEAGEDRGLHYLAVRYVPGASLADLLERAGTLPLPAILRIVAEVASGLGEIHRRNLVHRDVKPGNILLDRSGSAALTDFGLARGTADTILTAVGRIVGTVDYMAPELIRGETARPASDVYALGCVVFECLAGRAPFADRPLVETTLAHVEEEPPDPCADRDDVPPDLSWTVSLALAKAPEERPATATAYARLLAASAAAG